jgi:endonuclease III
MEVVVQISTGKGHPLELFLQQRFIPLGPCRTMDVMTMVEALSIIRERAGTMRQPVVSELVLERKDPYLVLISCLLSLRTKDETTRDAQRRLFEVASTPGAMVEVPVERIAELIYPVGFYRNKAKVIRDVSKDIIEMFDGRVPDDIDTLLTLKGVGRKTANLVVTMGYDRPGICVDTHVHRISNRFGFVRTRDPEGTEMELRKKLPPEHWKEVNDLLVIWGQNICRPVSPFCSRCEVSLICEKKGVSKSR